MQITLKAARYNRGLTQGGLANAVGVSKKTVGSWEKGKTLPTPDKIERICNALEVSYDNIKWKA